MWENYIKQTRESKIEYLAKKQEDENGEREIIDDVKATPKSKKRVGWTDIEDEKGKQLKIIR